MCGIVGIINYHKSYQPKMREIFMQLLLLDVVRGKESTGVFKAREKETDWRKAAVPAWEFFGLENVDQFFNGLGDWPFVVGHNRWATRGKVVHKNAHPFEEGHITLVHNGTLTSVYQLPDNNKFDVDSNMIAHSIKKIGIEETTKKMNGAYALAWYDAKKKNLNLLRNDERPLFLMDIPKENMYLFGSEIGLLKWVALRNGYMPGEWKSLEVNKLYTFEKGERVPAEKQLEAYQTKWSGTGYGYGSHWGSLQQRSGDDADFGDFPLLPVGATNPPYQRRTSPAFEVGGAPAQSNIVQFGKRKEVDPELIKKYNIGETLLFSVSDYDDKIYQGGFVPITGAVPGDDGKEIADLIVRGNFNGAQAHELAVTKCLLKGTITSIQSLKHGRLLIQVKECELTKELDPYFMSDAERNAWVEEKKKKKEAEAKKTCTQCWQQSDKLFLVYKTGGPKQMCLNCLHGFDPQGKVESRAVN